jgi:hypothetical protein
MKVCPKCTSISMRQSHASSPTEVFLRNKLGYRFYRCQQCNWRGKAKSRTKKKLNAKISIWKLLAIYTFAALLILFIVFVLIGVGGSTPPPAQ